MGGVVLASSVIHCCMLLPTDAAIVLEFAVRPGAGSSVEAVTPLVGLGRAQYRCGLVQRVG
jgi:hypothetical protein